jgi:acetyl-CoA acetyltransferase
MTGVRILGAGEASRVPEPGRTAGDLAVEAVLDALADAELDLSAIDGLVTGYSLTEQHLDFSSYLAEELAISPDWSCTVSRSGATGSSVIVEAALAVMGGACTTALAVWGDNRVSGRPADMAGTLASQLSPFEVAYGPLIATQYALVARSYLHTYGATPEDLAAVPVQFREHASRNPHAKYRKRISVDDVLSSPMASSPLHLLECALVTDYGGAVIISSTAHGPQTVDPVDILGFGESLTHQSIMRRQGLFKGGPSGAKRSSDLAFTMAGMTTADVEAAQIYDCFSITVLKLLEDFGFCDPGQAGPAVRGGLLSLDGRLPSNTNGGMLSCASGGILHVTEGVRQMRGTAGTHQVERIPGTTLVHGNGGILASQTTLLLGQG